VALTPDDIRALVDAFESSTWDEMSLKSGETRLDLSRTGRPPQCVDGEPRPQTGAVGTTPAGPAPVTQAPISPPTTEPLETSDHLATGTGHPPSVAAIEGHRVTAPSIGLFWESSQPGAPPFVEVGQMVGADDTVCIIEVMKLMNHVKAGVAARVLSIAVENGQMVEFGDLLMVLSTEG
jgi:acetyl-CoA carboxylase biotin carboxyl carrier protein